MDFNLDSYVRTSLLTLQPYQSAREEFVNQGRKMILLDANENPFETESNRYPDPLQVDLKERIAKWKRVPPDQLYLSNGSDEFISQLIMSCCEPKQDSILILPPTFGMYQVAARTHGVGVVEAPLTKDFQLDLSEISNVLTPQVKILFIPTPNNPTANSFEPEALLTLLNTFSGLVVIDEAYIEFSKEESFISQLEHYPNLVVCQTFAKAQGLAGARLGMAFAHPKLIQFLNRIKAPYNINSLTIAAALKRLEEQDRVLSQVDYILKERMKLETELPKISFIANCFPSDANFILVKVDNSTLRYDQLIDQGIVVRNPSKNRGCENTLRITVGRAEENKALLTALKNMES